MKWTEEEKEARRKLALERGYGKWMKGYKRPPGWVHYLKGKHHSEETKKKLSLANKGKKLTPEHRRKIADSKRGSKSHFWKGGQVNKMKQTRNGVEWKLWRETVFKRDDWTCQECGVRGGILHPHHIKEVSRFPELIYTVSNGLTLCRDCHKQTDSYGINHWENRQRNKQGQFKT